MQLLSRVAELLESECVRFVVIGASAMAVHGVSRSTLDVDLLTIDQRVLRQKLWTVLADQNCHINVRFGDVQDPLRGVVQIESAGQRPIDLIVGHGGWQEGIFDRAVRGIVVGVELQVADKTDLILLKLYAGGPQDLWDIQQLLSGEPSGALEERVEIALKGLPTSMRLSWDKVIDA